MLPLVCIDVDGTLIGASGTPTDAVWAAAGEAIRRGQHLAICTGRGAFGPTWDHARRLDPDGWHIFHTGAAVVHSRTDEVRASRLPGDVVAAGQALADEHEWAFELYTAQSYAVDRDNALARGHAALLGVPLGHRPFDRLEGDVVRAQFVLPVDDMDVALGADLGEAEISGATSPAQREAAFVSVTPAGVTKASAIAVIAAQLGITTADVMMVGDGQNDIDALAAVGHPVAMGNAVPEVKALAAHIVAPVEADGLVDALQLSWEP